LGTDYSSQVSFSPIKIEGTAHRLTCYIEMMELPENIEVRSDIMMGKPCFTGTRIPVYLILEKLAAGETSQDILDAYPELGPQHIKASLQYAARLAADEIVLTYQ
jgi:uncharacterized protein (DUF433 family)